MLSARRGIFPISHKIGGILQKPPLPLSSGSSPFIVSLYIASREPVLRLPSVLVFSIPGSPTAKSPLLSSPLSRRSRIFRSLVRPFVRSPPLSLLEPRIRGFSDSSAPKKRGSTSLSWLPSAMFTTRRPCPASLRVLFFPSSRSKWAF